jgi:predicted P-loop ATPase
MKNKIREYGTIKIKTIMNKARSRELRQKVVCDWLEHNYLNWGNLRHDIVTDRLQVRDLEASEKSSKSTSPRSAWRNLTDKDINTMVCECVHDTLVNVSLTEMWTALKSNMVPSVHPLRAWLEDLPPYTPDQPDWIDWLSQHVQVVGGEKANQYWRQCFKKWFVAMVASWMKDEVVNHTVLVFVGRQGIFKTTWLDRLIPPALHAYSSKLPLSGQITKDDRLRLCENAMLNIDELDAICGREMNIVKSLLTSTDVNERAAYGRLKEHRVRIASFCASTNNREFLTDVTGNRRWLPFEVEIIQDPFHTTLPYEQIYAQAKYIIEQGWFMYWFDLEEIEQLEKHNEEFRVLDNEEQLLPILFDIPAEGKGEFMTNAEISDHLVSYGNIKKPMCTSRLGILMKRLGYKNVQVSISGKSVRGWMVYKRNNEDIIAAKRTGLTIPASQLSQLY